MARKQRWKIGPPGSPYGVSVLENPVWIAKSQQWVRNYTKRNQVKPWKPRRRVNAPTVYRKNGSLVIPF